MIGYPISREGLEALIEIEKSGWLKRAGERTEKFREAKEYKEKSSIWSEVKPAYMKLQGDGKCVYCERKLESVDFGKGEQDVEHFRPKGNIRSWRMPKYLQDQDISATAVPDEKGGYYLLPYQPFNYAASCKPCNSALKRDYFPIAGEYNLSGDDPEKLISEQPYLIYPIGDFDKTPEDLICFHGVSPRAVASRGHDRLRALVTIDFFKLDDTRRKNLQRERAVIILALYPQLEKLANGAKDADRKNAEEIVDGFTSPKACHTNCARCFRISTLATVMKPKRSLTEPWISSCRHRRSMGADRQFFGRVEKCLQMKWGVIRSDKSRLERRSSIQAKPSFF